MSIFKNLFRKLENTDETFIKELEDLSIIEDVSLDELMLCAEEQELI